MTTRATPWDEIKDPKLDYNVRQVASGGSVPFYWGKDVQGRCLFIVQLDGDHSEQFRTSSPSVRGIGVDLRLVDSKQGLVLTLEQHIDRDLFYGLCETLAASLTDVPDSTTALAVTLAHINRWKVFMAGRKSRRLTDEELRGLFAELQFLRLLYKNGLEQKLAVEAWSGPDDLHQDFIFGDTAVEVKAVSGRERSTVRISSEDQMESLCTNLFLMVFRLSGAADSDRAMSLNDLVGTIEGELTESEALDNFSSQLATYGYVEMQEYDSPRFMISGRDAYRVTDGFPRLVRSSLPDGIRRVGYEIEFEKISPFACDTDQIWGSSWK